MKCQIKNEFKNILFSVLPGRCVGIAWVPGSALTRSPAPIMQWGLRAVVRRTTSC